VWRGRRWRTRFPVAPRTREGQALVEGALVVPILLVLLFGVLAVHQVAQAKQAVIAAAREGARTGVQAPGGDELAAATARGEAIAEGAGLTNGSFALTAGISGGRDGGYLATTATYRVVFVDWGALSRVGVEVRGEALERFDRYRDSRSYR
jgi:hypothetical protein